MMKKEIVIALTNRRFWMSTAIMLSCFFLFSIPTWSTQVEWLPEERSSAFMQSIGPIFFGGITLLFPFCAVLPYALSLVDELKTSFTQLQAIRCSVKRYMLQKTFAVAVSGGASLALAFILHAAIWSCIALPSNPLINDCHAIGFSSDVLYSEWYATAYGLPAYLYFSCAIFVCGALWSIVGLAVAVWIPDYVVTMTIPVGISYLWTYGILYYLFGLKIPSPSALYNDGLTIAKLINAIEVNGVVLAIALTVYYLGIRRRLVK